MDISNKFSLENLNITLNVNGSNITDFKKELVGNILSIRIDSEI